MKKTIGILGVLVLIAGGLYLIKHSTSSPDALQYLATASYLCNEGKMIKAEFYKDNTIPAAAAGEQPRPNGSVALALSDARTFSLKQTISADGIRYASSDESFVFWAKGNGALILENNAEKSFIGCIAVAPDPGGLPEAFKAPSGSFTLRHPHNFTVDSAYKYQELGPTKTIAGTKFTIAPALVEGTNLSQDSYISVEQIPQQPTCSADLFLDPQGRGKAVAVKDGEFDYSVASSTGAGAGNRYEEWVYAIPGTNPCFAVRYFIHSGAIQNYTPGTVKEFDHAGLIQMFDSARRTLVIL